MCIKIDRVRKEYTLKKIARVCKKCRNSSLRGFQNYITLIGSMKIKPSIQQTWRFIKPDRVEITFASDYSHIAVIIVVSYLFLQVKYHLHG